MTETKRDLRRFADFPPATIAFTGEVIRPEGPTFLDACKTPNALIDTLPALIVQCRSAKDILVAVNYCREKDEPMAIRGGGHSIDGYARPDGAFVIDTSLMKQVCIDPTTGITTVEAGFFWGRWMLPRKSTAMLYQP